MSDTTCWTVIRGAAAGRREDREVFARTYERVVRAYLGARWRGSALFNEIDDTEQEVFLACFKSGGALERLDGGRPFRPFFYGVVRNIARQCETRGARRKETQPSAALELARDDDGLSTIFDRAWALSILEQAVERQRRNAETAAARRRVELLRLRFDEDLPIRDIAKRWEANPARVHKDYARAREEFRRALAQVVAFHQPGAPDEVELECSRLLALFD